MSVLRASLLLLPLSAGLLWAGCSVESLESLESLEAAHLSQTSDASELSQLREAGGAGPTTLVSCEIPEQGTPGSCEAPAGSSECQACVERSCCAEQEACYATSPESACGFGSTLLDGQALEGGEIACMMECFDDLKAAGTFTGTDADVSACGSVCAASECGRSTVALTTHNLASCILGLGEDGALATNCAAECALTN